MGGYQPGDTIWNGVVLHNGTGAVDADSTPTATLLRNGTADGTVTLTVSKVSTGHYRITGAIPGSYRAGDVLEIVAVALLGGETLKAVVPLGVLDTRRAGIFDGTAASATASTLTLASAVPTPGDGTLVDRAMLILSGAGAGQSRIITGNLGKVCTVHADWSVTPDSTSVYAITETRAADVALWGGQAAGDAPSGTAPTAAEVATAVWTDTTAGDFTTVGSPGKALIDNLDATISSRLADADYTEPPSASTIATAVWANGTRTLSAFGFTVTVGTNNDKTGYSLTTAPPTAEAIATQILDTEQTGGGTIREAIRAIAAAEAGNLTETADGTATTIQDWADAATTRITSVNTNTTRTVTVAD